MDRNRSILSILFMRLYREYSSQRLLKLKILAPKRSTKSLFTPNYLHKDLLQLEETELAKIEKEYEGEIKLFGEDSLFFDDAKHVWLDRESRLRDLFFTQGEFSLFSQMFTEFLNSQGLLIEETPDRMGFTEFNVEEYLSRFDWQ